MKGKTLFFCPRDEDVLIFEEVYDERLDFAYQPPREMPRVCPKCGNILYKQDCIAVEELYPSLPQNRDGGAARRPEVP